MGALNEANGVGHAGPNGVSPKAAPNGDSTMGARRDDAAAKATMSSSSRAKPRPPPWLKWFMAHQLELSLSFLLFVLAGNVLFPPRYVLSTHYTPDPSWHLEGIFSRFLFLSFRKPGNDQLYYKGRE